MRLEGRWLGIFLMGAFICSSARSAEETPKEAVGGVVTKITPTYVEVRRGRDVLRFDRGIETDLPASVTVGDRVTIWYSREAHRIRESRQEAGQLPSGRPAEDRQIIIDDRAFYDARSTPSPKGGESEGQHDTPS